MSLMITVEERQDRACIDHRASGLRSVWVAPSEDSKTPVRRLVQFAFRCVSRYIQRTFLQPFVNRQIEDGADWGFCVDGPHAQGQTSVRRLGANLRGSCQKQDLLRYNLGG